MSKNIQEIKQKLFQAHYSFLNEEQRKAVLAPDGPILVIAGAGSGKTTVLINRIAYLVRYGNAYHSETEVTASPTELVMLSNIAENASFYSTDVVEPILNSFTHNPCEPDRILAITFTNKAAGEIKERLSKNLGDAANQIWAGTFHSICVRILRRFSEHTKFTNNFVIYDQDDVKKIITALLKEKNIDDAEITPRYVMNVISKAKNQLLTPEEFSEKNQGSEKRKLLAELYKAYQKELLSADAMDFDDLIGETVVLLRDTPEVLRWCQNKFRYVLVDEYQDTNHAQYLLMKLIAEGHRNVMVVGDDDQSIYKFRGAAVENILNFDKQFPDAKVILLEQNYRSTKSIIEAANAVICNNDGRRGKTLWSNNTAGRDIEITQLEDQDKEAVFIAETIQDLVKRGFYSYRDFAILYRTKAQSNALENVFAKSALPHRLLSGVRFYDHTEVKDILSYLRLIHNKFDFVSLNRIINVPRRGIGPTTMERVRDIAIKNEMSAFDVLCSANEFDDIRKSFSKISKFVQLIRELSDYANYHSVSELLHKVIDDTGYMETLLGDENEDRRKNIDELFSSAALYEDQSENSSLSGFLEEIALVSDVDNYDKDSNSVVLMTVHAAKGLEFPVVFLAGMEENLFPSPMSCATQADLEEERRLAYVAMTRAKTELFITCCHHRMIYGRTSMNDISRFVKEIPKDYSKITLYSPAAQKTSNSYSHKKGNYGVYSVTTFDSRQGSVRSSYPAGSPMQKKQEKAIKFSAGDRVVHGFFGPGTILEAKAYGSDTLYRIRFDKGEEKKLMATYAKLKPEK